MINLLIQQHLTLKKAALMLLVYEMRHGPLTLKDRSFVRLASNAEVKLELKQTIGLYYRWRRQQGHTSQRKGGKPDLPPNFRTKPSNEAAWMAIRKLWASGKWPNRDSCARACYKQVGFTNMAEARQALVRQPSPFIEQT